MSAIPPRDLLDTVVVAADRRARVIVAIAGPPGAGKSTLSSSLAQQLTTAGHSAAVVPMDGFHLDNDTLDRLGMRDRKGAPETFNADGFIALVEQLRINAGDVAVPEFDRASDSVRTKGGVVSKDCRFVLVEGNYLLLDDEPWSRLRPLFDLTVFLTAPMTDLRERLIARWLEHGYDRRTAEEKAGGNDIPNAQLVLSGSRTADVIVQSAGAAVHSP
ncbi:nucleoside triphosphate hydrolase [Hoeflea poritis]|uniref:Nucleoside triphosphate hydrolase n=1 Tax=Hoeflea poritis TaxID=2993659 RepID=A0ABT4VHS6_9HYPH|nr:nucleoside triphosphate hydrolase [Hoeflea poritis]MDA4844256.1 nucleoside triphosphate hydrolase [Hoeflea poritis]